MLCKQNVFVPQNIQVHYFICYQGNGVVIKIMYTLQEALGGTSLLFYRDSKSTYNILPFDFMYL